MWRPQTIGDVEVCTAQLKKLSDRQHCRKQGTDESPVMYCPCCVNYLCNRMDPRMTEGVKLDHLILGMKPTLVQQIYPSIDFAYPNTFPNAFVQLVQLHHQATLVANSNDWFSLTLTNLLTNS